MYLKLHNVMCQFYLIKAGEESPFKMKHYSIDQHDPHPIMPG